LAKKQDLRRHFKVCKYGRLSVVDTKKLDYWQNESRRHNYQIHVLSTDAENNAEKDEIMLVIMLPLHGN